MKIGVINQVDDIEQRVLLIPADVAKLIKQCHCFVLVKLKF